MCRQETAVQYDQNGPSFQGEDWFNVKYSSYYWVPALLYSKYQRHRRVFYSNGEVPNNRMEVLMASEIVGLETYSKVTFGSYWWSFKVFMDVV
jgi:hypothetical protein